MLGVAVLGASGRMGRRVVQQVVDAEDLQLTAALVSPSSSALGVDAGVLAGRDACGVTLAPVSAGPSGADVVIDFALPSGTLALLPILGDAALVTGTTGLTSAELTTLHGHATRGPLLHAANFSTGVNVLLALVGAASRALPDFDIEIVEAHHTQKVDAPSGTALALASAAADARGWALEDVRSDGRVGRTGPRPAAQIGLHALRAGAITGHHEVWLAGPEERIRLEHTASSRDVFAAGALRAARWIAGRAPGFYSMRDVLGLTA